MDETWGGVPVSAAEMAGAPGSSCRSIARLGGQAAGRSQEPAEERRDRGGQPFAPSGGPSVVSVAL